MPSKSYNRYLLQFFPFMISSILLCSPPDNTVISVNERTSECGGFKTLAKRTGSLIPDDTIPCLEETLFWRYDTLSDVLTLVRRCINANCAAQLSMSVVQKDGAYVINKFDKRDPNLSANCMCTFDLYCEIPEITERTVILSIDTISSVIDLNKQKGTIVVHPLEYLDLYNQPYTDLTFLSAYPHLKQLGHVDTRMFSDLTPIGSLQNLQSLSCINVDSISFITVCKNLTYLDLQGTPLLNNISALASLSNLTMLYLSGISSVQDISSIGNCNKLKQLALTNCNSVTTISRLEACTDLTELRITGSISLSTLDPLTSLTKLTTLTLDSIPKVLSLEPLRSLSSLQSLSITNNDILTDLSPLSQLNILRNLNLINLSAVSDFTPLLSCLGEGDTFTYGGMSIPAEILEQLKKKGVAFKGSDRR